MVQCMEPGCILLSISTGRYNVLWICPLNMYSRMIILFSHSWMTRQALNHCHPEATIIETYRVGLPMIAEVILSYLLHVHVISAHHHLRGGGESYRSCLKWLHFLQCYHELKTSVSLTVPVTNNCAEDHILYTSWKGSHTFHDGAVTVTVDPDRNRLV